MHIHQLDLNLFTVFEAIHSEGSVTRAGQKLNLTQPAVTRRVQSFEATVGVPLLDRSSKPPALTEDGRQALAYVGNEAVPRLLRSG